MGCQSTSPTPSRTSRSWLSEESAPAVGTNNRGEATETRKGLLTVSLIGHGDDDNVADSQRTQHV